MAQNNDNSGAAMGFALVVTAIWFFMAAVFAIAAFFAFILTIMSIMAWNKPLTFGKNTITTEEARSFIKHGLAGAFLLPAFALFCGFFLQWPIRDEAWIYIVVAGYSSVIIERLQGFQPGSAARWATDGNSFDPADMKHERTALFVIGSARSDASRTFVGAMMAAVIERFADAHGPLRALVVGEEWGQLYVSNFYEILTLYRQGGVNFLGVFQNAAAQIESRYGRETARIWKKAVAHTLYRGLPDNDTLKEIEHRSGKTSVMVRGFNVSNNQVNGSGDNLSEQSRPLLQVEDIRAATGGETALLESRDLGYFVVDVPSFWERPEMDGYLRDVRMKPDKYAWLERSPKSPAIRIAKRAEARPL